MKCHWNLLPAGENSSYGKKAHNLNWSLIWTDSRGGAPKHQNQTIHAYYLSDWHVLKTERGLLNQSLRDLPRLLILKAQTSRNRGYLVSRPFVSLLSFWELSHFQPGLCVASIFHTSDNAPQPRAATLIFMVYCSRLRDSARHSKPCNSVISTSSILACTADKQPNTEVMNKSQYSTYTLTDTRRFILCIFFWAILVNSESNVVFSFMLYDLDEILTYVAFFS